MSYRTIGLVGAIFFGAAAGVAASPPAGRRIALARLRHGADAAFAELLREAQALADVMPALFDLSLSTAERLAATLGITLAPDTPTARLEAAFASDHALSKRKIWVDAHGTTLLLHGVVEGEDESRNAEAMARRISADGSVRNLLQIRRHSETE